MKKLIEVASVVLAGWLSATSVLATNPIEARIGPVRALIVSPTMAFTADHVSKPFNGLTLTLGGKPYQPSGPNWFRFTDASGKLMEDSVENFTIRTRERLGLDGSVVESYRPFPREAVERIAIVKAGDPVVVDSIRFGRRFTATVRSSNPVDHTITTDYPAEGGTALVPGDSGSLVTTPDGIAVGLVSTQILGPNQSSIGSMVSVPPDGATPPPSGPTDPGPKPPSVPSPSLPAPTPVIPPPLEVEAYQRGYNTGKKDALSAVTKELEALIIRLKAAQ